ncbi:33 kDa chaperonin [Candidatus Phycosocius bacilliformis]|uniref:33 kDa chaperonin n=1 Tax=Candidatus Phycosocius bacilliformis TaxID=1445552 RepID=A0A2P2EBW3_9PROT|nr:Hsp33 family molecular chaperone HslO [Candidatus Phycosocius bacilliformis]GBF58560.1 33 kDa chaperonin [Candidatus Phycosocius bacilliformis]
MSFDANPADPDADPMAAADDIVAAFQIDGEPVRGRIVRLGPATVDEILQRHAYPDCVARLLGELLTLAALVGASLKFDGKLIIQVQGEEGLEGAVRFMVAEYRTAGALRGYANIDHVALAKLLSDNPAPGLPDLIGQGLFVMTVDQGDDMDRYQGTVALEGDTLAEAASLYFAQSEQIPTRIRVACSRKDGPGGRHLWRAGGALIQQVAGDSARGDTALAWENAAILFETLEDRELVNADLSAGEVLFRLYHEDGVRLFEAKPIETACTCSSERILALLRQFGREAAAEMVEADGLIRVRCEYCNKSFDVRPEELL